MKKGTLWWPAKYPKPVKKKAPSRQPWLQNLTETPGPGSYSPRKSHPTSRNVIIGTAPRVKKDETKECMGGDSPGPCYMIDESATTLTRKSPKTIKFSTTSRPELFGVPAHTPAGTDYTIEEPQNIPGGTFNKEPAISFWKLAKASGTPGPSAYYAEHDRITRKQCSPAYTFANGKGHDLDEHLLLRDMTGPISNSQDMSCDPAYQQDLIKPRAHQVYFSKSHRDMSLPGTTHVTPGPGEYEPNIIQGDGFEGKNSKAAKFGGSSRKYLITASPADQILAESYVNQSLGDTSSISSGWSLKPKNSKSNRYRNTVNSASSTNPNITAAGSLYSGDLSSVVHKKPRGTAFYKAPKLAIQDHVSIAGRLFRVGSPNNNNNSSASPSPQTYSPEPVLPTPKGGTIGKAKREPSAGRMREDNGMGSTSSISLYRASSTLVSHQPHQIKGSSTFGHAPRDIFKDTSFTQSTPGPGEHDPSYTLTKPAVSTPNFVKDTVQVKRDHAMDLAAEPSPNSYSPSINPTQPRAPTAIMYLTA